MPIRIPHSEITLMRFVNQIYTTTLGEAWDNPRLLAAFEPMIDRLEGTDEQRKAVRDFVRFQLVGQRSRHSINPDWAELGPFQGRAEAFQRGVEEACDALAEQILPEAESRGVQFDAVIATTASGNLMPGISYRIARRLGRHVGPNSMLIDLSNVGCTGSSKALNLARSLDDSYRNVLIVAVELPSTMVNARSLALDAWQGNCTFGDGAAALWVTREAWSDAPALAIEEMHYRQHSVTGIDLIRWGYGEFYHFALADEKSFEREVRELLSETLRDTESGWRDEPRWAIHPAGILILMRLTRALGIPKEAIQPSASHFREYSNMSSVSVLHVLKDLVSQTPVGGAVNLLTMGAGFNVVYGRLRRVS